MVPTRRTRLALICAAVLALAIVSSGCGSGGSSTGSTSGGETTANEATETAAASEVAPPKPPAGSAKFEAAKPGSGKGMTIGFIQLTLASTFPQEVQKGMEEQAKRAGLTLVTCDSKLEASKALECAKNFKTRGVEGMVTFQADAESAPAICAAGPQVPVIAVDVEQKPCEIAFMGAANQYAGELLGYNLGVYFQEKFECDYDAFVSLEALVVGVVNEERMGGIRTGFESVCGPIHDLHRIDTGGAASEIAQQKMTDTLTALPGQEHIITVSIDEDSILGALAAARAQNRTEDLYLGSENFDPDNCPIYSDPNWVGSIAYFPERYAEILIPNIIRAVKGQKIPRKLLVEHQFINAENAKQYYPDFSC